MTLIVLSIFSNLLFDVGLTKSTTKQHPMVEIQDLVDILPAFPYFVWQHQAQRASGHEPLPLQGLIALQSLSMKRVAQNGFEPHPGGPQRNWWFRVHCKQL